MNNAEIVSRVARKMLGETYTVTLVASEEKDKDGLRNVYMEHDLIGRKNERAFGFLFRAEVADETLADDGVLIGNKPHLQINLHVVPPRSKS